MDKIAELLTGIDWTPCDLCVAGERKSSESCPECHGWRYPGVRALVERLLLDVDVMEQCARSYDRKQPFCEHENRYAFTDDGGKTGRCVMCSEADLRSKLAAAQGKLGEYQQKIFSHKHLDHSCVEKGCQSLFIAELEDKLAAAHVREKEIILTLNAENKLMRAKLRASEEDARRLREALEKIARPALGGKEQQWYARDCLAALKERDVEAQPVPEVNS